MRCSFTSLRYVKISAQHGQCRFSSITQLPRFRATTASTSGCFVALLRHSDDHRQDIDDLMTNGWPDVADRAAATFNGNGTKLFHESATSSIKLVGPVGHDLNVAGKRSRCRRQRNDEHGGRAESKERVSDDNDCGPGEASVGTNWRSEVNTYDVAKMQASAQVRVEPRVSFSNITRPSVGLRTQRRLGISHLAEELVAAKRLKCRIEGFGHRAGPLVGKQA